MILLDLMNYFSKPKKEFGLDLTPDVLDTLWGYFYATGEYRPLGRIILMLRWTRERDVLEKLTLGSMRRDAEKWGGIIKSIGIAPLGG